MRSLGRRILIVVSAIALLGSANAIAASFAFRSTDAADEGLNSVSAFTPIGGNNASSLGEARMNVLREAGRVWGGLIQSNVTILVDVAFDPQTCTANSGTLGSAGARSMFVNFAGGTRDVFYVSALADALAGRDLSSQPSRADIVATFNSAVDDDPGCLAGRGFYYGFDHNRGNRLDLLLVVLHELGHGLGFTSDVDLTTGAGTVGGDGIERFNSYTYQVIDETLNRSWPSLAASERLASAARTGALAWNGTNTNAQLNRYTQGGTVNGRFRLNAPATVSTGSSVSHWDPIVTPNALMEPNLPGSITTSSVDITACALRDIGWTVTQCPHDATNFAPVATNQSVTVAEDTSIPITLVATDVNGDPLTYAVATNPSAGTLSAINNTTHTVTYTPNANSNGTDSFSFTASDSVSISAPAVVSIVVTPANDAPTVNALSISATSGQAANVLLLGNDIDGDALTYLVVTSPTSGVLSGTAPNLLYRSNDGFTGSDSFTYRVNDGTLNSATATVTITVNAPTPASSGGGGGAMGFAISWLLAGAAWLRCKARQR